MCPPPISRSNFKIGYLVPANTPPYIQEKPFAAYLRVADTLYVYFIVLRRKVNTFL